MVALKFDGPKRFGEVGRSRRSIEEEINVAKIIYLEEQLYLEELQNGLLENSGILNFLEVILETLKEDRGMIDLNFEPF